MGDVPPTGKRVELQLCEVHRIEGGKIRSSEHPPRITFPASMA
jgi:hypothetical protein